MANLTNTDFGKELEILFKEKARDIHYALIEKGLVPDSPSSNADIRQQLVENIKKAVQNISF